MSLILDALRKREQEKQVPERGMLVVAHRPWPVRRRGWLVAGSLVLASGLAGGMLALWSRGPRGGAPGPEPPPTLSRAAAPAPTGPPSTAPAAAEPEPARPPGPSPADPPRAGAPLSAALVLHAISQRDGRPIAMIGQRLVREGDSFDGVTVVRIGDGEVELDVRGERRVLRF